MRKLPVRMHQKGRTYYYVHQNKWTRLSADYGEALRIYAGLMAPQDGSVPDLLARYITGLRVAASTLKTYRCAAEIVSKAMVEFTPADVKPQHIYALMQHHRDTPAMANTMRKVLLGALQLAINEGTIERNPARETKEFPQKPRDRYVTDAELAEIRDASSPALQSIIDVCYLTGQRIGDVLKLAHKDITDAGVYFCQQKTGARLIVKWSPQLRAAIDRAKAMHQCVKGLTLFHGHAGRPYAYSTVRTLWDRATKKAEVADAHIHDIRAKAATDAHRQGIDSKGLLGHASEAVHAGYLRAREVPIVTPVGWKS